MAEALMSAEPDAVCGAGYGSTRTSGQPPHAKHPGTAEHLDEARPDLLAFIAFPRLWRQIWSNNSQRLNKEQLVVLFARGDRAEEIEVLVLRHQIADLRRQDVLFFIEHATRLCM